MQPTARDTRWDPPGLTWGLEWLTLATTICALLVPYLATHHLAPPTLSAQALSLPLLSDWQQRFHGYWLFFVVAMYLGHIVVNSLTLNHVSTTWTSLVLPTVMIGITYTRLLQIDVTYPSVTPILKATWWEAVAYIGSTAGLSMVMARNRKAQCLARFETTEWAMVSKTHMDRSLIKLVLLRWRPLFYLPQEFRATKEGILVVGWNYVMPIPCREVQSISDARHGDFLSSGFYAATSAHELLKIQLYETDVPIYISPQENYRFLQYLQQQIYGKAQVDPWREQETHSS